MPLGLQPCLCTTACTKFLSARQRRYHRQRLREARTQIFKQTIHSEPGLSESQSDAIIQEYTLLNRLNNDNDLKSPNGDMQRYSTDTPGARDIDAGYMETEATIESDNEELSSDTSILLLDDMANYELNDADSHASLSETESLELEPEIVDKEELRDYLEWIFGDTWTEQMFLIGKFLFFYLDIFTQRMMY
jgi:hypothetical protein